MSRRVQVAVGKRGGRIAGYRMRNGKMEPIYVDDTPSAVPKKKAKDAQRAVTMEGEKNPIIRFTDMGRQSYRMARQYMDTGSIDTNETVDLGEEFENPAEAQNDDHLFQAPGQDFAEGLLALRLQQAGKSDEDVIAALMRMKPKTIPDRGHALWYMDRSAGRIRGGQATIYPPGGYTRETRATPLASVTADRKVPLQSTTRVSGDATTAIKQLLQKYRGDRKAVLAEVVDTFFGGDRKKARKAVRRANS